MNLKNKIKRINRRKQRKNYLIQKKSIELKKYVLVIKKTNKHMYTYLHDINKKMIISGNTIKYKKESSGLFRNQLVEKLSSFILKQILIYKPDFKIRDIMFNTQHNKFEGCVKNFCNHIIKNLTNKNEQQ